MACDSDQLPPTSLSTFDKSRTIMADAQPPLAWQTSDSSHPQQASTLPPEVVTCLENARFVSTQLPLLTDLPLAMPVDPALMLPLQLHLATCTDNQPHVSLMNYTYLPSNPFTSSSDASAAPSNHALLPSGPTIIMTTNPSSKKTLNLLSNPSVSLLVHDWVSHRPPTNSRSISPDGRRTGNPARSSLATLLMGMNTSAMGSISATINGTAHVLPQGSEEEKWCKLQHLENNTFEEHPMGATAASAGANATSDSTPSAAFAAGGGEDGGRGAFVEDEDVRVVVVKIRDGRIADWKGGVKDWVLASEENPQPLVNGL